MVVRHHRRRRSAAQRAEAGVTLVELILAIAISTVIVGAITQALVVGFRTTDDTSARLSRSHDTQLVANYFPADVASTRNVEVKTAPAAAGCSGVPAGQTVVLLPFAPRLTASPAPVTVAYRTEPATAPDRLVRYQCGAVGSAVQDRVVVATNITAAQAIKVTTDSDTQQPTTTLTVTEVGGRTFRVTGHPRTPEYVPFTATTLPPPTTARPAPCAASVAATAAPAAVSLSTAAPTELVADIAITVTTSGSCTAPLTVNLSPGASAVAIPMSPATADEGYTATLGRAAFAWTAGVKAFTITQGGDDPIAAGSSSGSFAVIPAACTVQTPVAVDPGPVTLAAAPPAVAGALQAPLTVSFTTVGSCPVTLRLRLTPGATEVTRDLVRSGNSYAVTIAANEGGFAWTVGAKTVTIEATGGGPVVDNQFPLSVNPAPAVPCVASSPTMAPNPARLANGGKVESPVTVTFTTTGTCTGLEVAYTPEGTTPFLVVAGANGTTWTATLPVNPPGNAKWDVGDHPITISGTTNNPAPSASLRVVKP